MSDVEHPRKFIGGSDAGTVLGVNPYRTALALWLDKIQPPRDDGRNAAAKKRGKRLEPYIVDMIREEHDDIDIGDRNVRVIDREHSFLAAEIDFECTTSDGLSANGEIKTVHPFKAREWGEELTDELPMFYVAQAQHGLMVTERHRTLVFALIGDDLRRYVVERDDEIIAAMREREVEFWTRFVEPRVRPPIDWEHSETLAEIKRLYPGTDGTVIRADDMDRHWRAVYDDARRMSAQFEAVARGAETRMLARMGHAAAVRFDDGMEFRRKVVKRKAYTTHLRAAEYVDFRLVKTKED